MYTFYEQQHPGHTEGRRQALRDAAAKERAIRRVRQMADNALRRPPYAAGSWPRSRSIAPRWTNSTSIRSASRPPHTWQAWVDGGVVWILAAALVLTVILVAAGWR